MPKARVLFLCTHNSARSQMAEGLLRAAAGDRFEVHSAGTVATTVRPEAAQVMAEIGVDIAGHESKTLDRFRTQAFDWVITVCDDAAEACPVFPGPARRLHWSLPDPGAVVGDEERRLAAFRKVRDRLRALIGEFVRGRAGDPRVP
ncbi:MAG: arsenate reductase ArsC [Armatimonadota bacterium]|nr:arsenate reductase ArsC [Armatimonadota bacterium]MDR7422377.1 arsenate reductase ArsC [Armatimonadota bacterium]MDR7454833.1 arsenate reductase ArsC [Armatimonadota bacterium]MDR7457787.1 arsenate reductase ArsC [Armatimonadota bacterium]MDR7497069.1 arsenate reductase ArsC [Armatimonadota bacterium]